MKAKKLVKLLHLWLGIPSGLLVFFIAISGCLCVFQTEIQQLTQPYRRVETQQQPILQPSILQQFAQDALPDKALMSLNYRGKGEAVEAQFYGYEPDYYYSVFLNPYSGKVLYVLNNNSGFFQWIIRGHAYLWLPEHIGQPIVATATLIFVILLITGIVLWFPKNSKMLKNNLWFRWKAKTNWNRKRFDLHNILGFYSFLFALCIALTGLVYGFQWFSDAAYKVTGGEKEFYPTPALPFSDGLSTYLDEPAALDSLYRLMQLKHPDVKVLTLQIPEPGASILYASANLSSVSYWKTDNLYFDRFTLKELPTNAVFGRLEDANGADLLRRMNYDIHVGSIGGLPGKILAFFIALFAASLPVTGFWMWYKHRFKMY